MTTSDKGFKLIKEFEGCKLYAYRCPAGVLTIGYGHTKGVKAGMAITQDMANKYLQEDVKFAENALNKMGIKFSQNEFDALVSWLFNLGEGNFNTSTLKKKIIAKAPAYEITDQIIKWIKAGGKVQTGLQKRRIAEANMYIGHNLYYLDKGEIKKKV